MLGRSGRPCDHAAPVPAVLRRVRGGASDSVLRQSGGFSCFTETGAVQTVPKPVEFAQVLFLDKVDDTRCCTTTGAWV